MFIKFLDYLFFKYYHWQIKVGNKGIAKQFSMLFIVFITSLLVMSIVGFSVMFVIPKEFVPGSLLSAGSAFISFGLIFIFYYFLFFYKKRYKEILKRTELKKKSNFWAIMLPILIFIFLFGSMMIKMLQNQGKL